MILFFVCRPAFLLSSADMYFFLVDVGVCVSVRVSVRVFLYFKATNEHPFGELWTVPVMTSPSGMYDQK